MKITASSTFHDCMDPLVFCGCKEGLNIRRLRGPRSRYCLDYSNNNSHVCGCGFPIYNTDWDATDGYIVYPDGECGKDGNVYDKGYIRIVVRPDYDE